MQHYNGTFQYWALIAQTTWIFTAIVNATIAIVKLSLRFSIMCIAVIIVLLYLFKKMSYIHTYSVGLLTHALPPFSRAPWFSRVCLAYRPLRANVGALYYADKTLVLTIITTILSNTATLVLAEFSSHT